MNENSPTISTPQDRRLRAARADTAFEALMADRLHSPGRKLFGWRNWWMARTYEHLWPVANAWSALCTLASLPDHAGVRDVLSLLLGGLPSYHRDGPAVLAGRGPVGFESSVVPPLGRGGDVYYDDNAWLGLALVRHHVLCDDELSLKTAERLFRFVVTGWASDEGWAVPGGVRWKATPSSTSRHTCVNGPAAALGTVLSQLTGDPGPLEWAVRIYRWTRSALLREDGLYADRVLPDGAIVGDLWTYNQGSMIGAGTLLAESTGDGAFLADARATAAASLARFDFDDLVRNGPAFNAVYFRNLLLLSDTLSDTVTLRDTVPSPCTRPAGSSTADVDVTVAAATRALAGAYDDILWEERDPRTGVLPGGGSPLSRMGPLVQIDALLAGAAPHP